MIRPTHRVQSRNEGLQAAKEEQQSTNEELATLNEKLQNRYDEVGRLNNDLINVIGSIEMPIVIIGGDRLIRRFTPSARRIMNLVGGDIGRPIDDIKHSLKVPHLSQWISEVFVTLTMKEAEVEGQDGRWYRIQIRPYKTTDDKIDGAVLSLTDINVLKDAVETARGSRDDARHAQAEAEEANRSKDVFLATLSHELRTPLATVLMQAQLLHRGGLNEAKTKRATESIERAARLQIHLIDDLLDVSCIVAGKLNMELGAVDLASVVQTALDAVRPLAEAKSVQLEVALEPVGPVSGDAMRLHQVVWNLLTNAIKFTPKEGQVLVTLERIDTQARIRVSDTGLGIKAEFLPRVFDLFSQADTSTTRAYGGLGLGLAIVHRLVELHGGTVHAESPGDGKGATFSVTLPLTVRLEHLGRASDSKAIHAAAPSPGKDQPAQLNGIRILLVEDDQDGREAFAETLKQSGAEVNAVASAAEAIQVIGGEFEPEVILCDISIPGEDGYSLLRRIRELSSERGGWIPAAALTAHVSEEKRRRSLSAGFQMHISKPLDATQLKAAVVELLACAKQ